MDGVFIHTTAVIDGKVDIGEGTKVWHFTHLMSGASIGSKCILGQNVFVAPGVIIGDGVKVQNNVSLYEGVVIEDSAFVGPSVVFTNVMNPRSNVERKDQFKKTIVRIGASIGANATILCGIELGKYCFIGAGSVVTKPVKEYELVSGNPAKHMGWMSERGRNLHFGHSGSAVCPEDGSEYVMNGGFVTKTSE